MDCGVDQHESGCGDTVSLAPRIECGTSMRDSSAMLPGLAKHASSGTPLGLTFHLLQNPRICLAGAGRRPAEFMVEIPLLHRCQFIDEYKRIGRIPPATIAGIGRPREDRRDRRRDAA